MIQHTWTKKCANCGEEIPLSMFSCEHACPPPKVDLDFDLDIEHDCKASAEHGCSGCAKQLEDDEIEINNDQLNANA